MARVLLLLIAFYLSGFAQSCEIRMGYRTTARDPYIKAEPDNSGLYLDLYSQAAKRIGCTLTVLRAPKNRILHYVQSGEIDFYPGLSYSPERLDVYLFAPNGLPERQVGLTLAGVKPIQSYEELRGKDMLIASGGATYGAENYGILLRRPPELSFKRAMDLVLTGKVFIFRDDESTFLYYLRNNPQRQRFMLHTDCCESAKQFTLGISLKSKNAVVEPNPAYRPAEPRGLQNEPLRLAAGCIMQRFTAAVQALSNEGFTRERYQFYFGSPMPSLGR